LAHGTIPAHDHSALPAAAPVRERRAGHRTSRFWKWRGRDKEKPEAWADRIARAEEELDVLEAWLSEHEFLAAGRYTVADIANYAYTHVAHEVLDMSARPAIAAWIARVESQPGFVNDLSPFP